MCPPNLFGSQIQGAPTYRYQHYRSKHHPHLQMKLFLLKQSTPHNSETTQHIESFVNNHSQFATSDNISMPCIVTKDPVSSKQSNKNKYTLQQPKLQPISKHVGQSKMTKLWTKTWQLICVVNKLFVHSKQTILGAGGKASTWLPPGRLVELPQLPPSITNIYFCIAAPLKQRASFIYHARQYFQQLPWRRYVAQCPS